MNALKIFAPGLSRMAFAHRFAVAGLLVSALALSACGGKDKDPKPTPAPSAPSVSVSASSAKTLKFTWAPASYATSYKLLKNEGGSSGYSPVAENITGTSATDTVSVHLHDWANTRYILEACNATGCTASAPVVTTNAMLNAIGALHFDTPQANDYLGYSLAMSRDGNYLAVGATNRDVAVDCEGDAECVVDNAGAVAIFHLNNGTWSQQAELDVAVGDVNDSGFFGYVLAFSDSGDTLAVGTPFEASDAQGVNGERNDASAEDAGAVYVFVRNGTSWQEQAYLKASNAEAHDYFGSSVALSDDGDTLFVGAPGEASKATGINGDQTDNTVGISGAVYVFERSEGAWAQAIYLKPPQSVSVFSPCFDPSPIRCLPRQGSRFGSSLAVTPDLSTLVVGAIYDHSNATGVNGEQNNLDASRSGAAHVYVNTESGWTHQAYLKASNPRVRTHFGHKLALSEDGNTLAVSSIKESSQALGVNGNQADTSATDAGAVYVFDRDGSSWSQAAYIKASNTAAYADFGSSLSLSADGNWLAVGAAREKSDAVGIGGDEADTSLASAGAVYLFQRGSDVWTQARYIKAPVAANNGSFGYSLVLSDDGETLAVGAMGAAAPQEGASALSNAGAVYLY